MLDGVFLEMKATARFVSESLAIGMGWKEMVSSRLTC